uniref:polysaccharide biosynthesis protein n=1 Tax=uncultured Allobacillus sp. TaxID=1638025 RepID=UPI0025961C9B|nr:polysaccharide biosynthesis protein [uncultured Allobacillus sp.]
MSDTNKWVKGAIILTITGLISRILGMVYRVPLQNIAGDEGLYVYQQIYPLLSLAIILSLYGIPSAVTQQFSENQTSRQLFTRIFYLLTGLGILAWLVIYLFAQTWANMMGDIQLTEPIRISSFMFLLLPMISLLRGYFQSYEETHLVGISQVVEQFVRVILIIGITFYVVSTDRSLYELGTLAALATIIGTFVAVVYLGIKFLRRKNSVEVPPNNIPFRQTAKWFFAGVFIYSLTYVLHLIFQAVDVMTMIPLLQEYGWSFEESKVQKGIFDRGNPMIQLGLVFGSSLAFALIPSIQSKRKQGEAEQAVQMTFLFSLAAAAGLIAIMPFLNPLFYLNQQGTTAIQWLMLLVFLLSLIITLSVLLQSIGYTQQQFKWIVFMFAVKIACNFWLIPIYGILGASIASILSAATLVIIYFWIWMKRSSIHIDVLFYIKAVVTIGLMYGVVVFMAQLFSIHATRLFLIVPTIALSLVGVITVFTMAWAMKLFPKNFLQNILKKSR